jgi:co-chaperonin GroES (HSP10)
MSKAKKEENKVKVVVGVEPFGNQVLVERLNEDELLGSSVIISNKTTPSNQGYVLAIGPLVVKDYGLKVGQRVLLQGSFVPVPNFTKSEREQNLVYPDMIKAVLHEE